MNKPARRLLQAAVVLLVLGAPAYYALALHSPAAGTPYPLDLAQLRALAGSVPGAKPTEVRYETVMALEFAEAMIMAGAPWDSAPMPVSAYQVVYPDGTTIMVDSALDRSIAKPEAMVLSFDDAAYGRMNAALERAAQIVITHEHMDHIGGITVHPHLAGLQPALRLTREQLANPKGMDPAVMPPLPGYQPLDYEGMLALAPGVVLLAAPGHTPGSQMVFVQRADGREILFLGDVSWRRRNIEEVRERPLFMTLLIGEDRHAVLGQFEALHRLMQTDPAIGLVPGHDGPALQALERDGLLRRGFL